MSTERHPLSNQSVSGADKIVQILADQGVDTLFGYSGGAILPVFDAVFRFNQTNKHADGSEVLPMVVPANEQGAGFMASGYARASGKPGVVIVTSGPGATNCVTPIRDAMADSIPMIIISGQVSTGAIGTDAFQEAPVNSLMGSIAKHVFLVTDPEKLEATVRTAFFIASSGRPGPVVIDIPKDIQNHVSLFEEDSLLDLSGYKDRVEKISKNRMSEAQSRDFYAILKDSKKPLIYAGGGSIHANISEELKALCENLNIPIVTTLMGIGVISTEHKNCLNMLGMHGAAYANYAIDDCDVLIAIGSRFDDRVAGDPPEFAPTAKKIMHFDIDPSEINKVKGVDFYFLGDIKQAIADLNQYHNESNLGLDFTAWLKECQENKNKYAMNYDKNSSLIQPYAVIEKINELTKGNAIISTGVGQHQMWAAQYATFHKSRLWLTSGSMGTMGFGLPAAIGAQFARPDALVIDIDGDGSIRMNIGELETASSYNLPIKVLLLNNLGDGMVMQWQRMFYQSRMSASDKSLRKKDFIKTAQADGFDLALRVTENKELDSALKQFIEHKGPAFLEVLIDPEASVLPMVPPGQSYKHMVTGDFIPNRYEESDKEVDSSAMF